MKHIDIIENGTVIDHIITGMGLKILSMIGSQNDMVTVGLNLYSSKYGKKDIIKYSNKSLTESDLTLISSFSPDATINIVTEGKVIKKNKLLKPDIIEKIIDCPNPNCITNHEYSTTKFMTQNGVRCYHCERKLTHLNMASNLLKET